MSKPRRKNKNELEYFRGLVRELEKENRALKKRLKQLEQKEHIFDDAQDDLSQDNEISGDSEDTHPTFKKIPCDSCGKGFLLEYEIMGKVIGTCNICNERKRIK